MFRSLLTYSQAAWQDVLHGRGRYPWLLLLCCFVPFLLFELVPEQNQNVQMWLYLAGTVGTVLACVDLLLLMRRIYTSRGDLSPLLWPLLLTGALTVLICLGRMLRFASFFVVTLYVSETVIVLLTGGILIVSVLAARSAENYLVKLPKLADLKAAHDEAQDATKRLQLREKMAMEAMVVSADNTIIEANPWAYRILEYDQSKNELLGMRSHQLIHEDDHRTVYQNIQSNHTEPYVVRALTKNGGIKYIQVVGANFERSCMAADLKPDVVRITNFRDVTVERLYLRELESLRCTPDEAACDRISADLADLRSYFHFTASSSSNETTSLSQ